MSAYDRLQAELGPALAASRPGSTTDHVVVALPSHSMPTTLMRHNAPLVPALEQRALTECLRLGQTPGAHVVVVLTSAPDAEVLDYYARLARPDSPRAARERTTVVVVPDDSTRGIAEKLLDRPDLIAHLRGLVEGRLAVIEPWNVTANEVQVALALDAPINGSPPSLWPSGFKSASRRLFRDAGVPVPAGVEGVRGADDVAAAVQSIRQVGPSSDRVVIKLDNFAAGDGNWVMATSDVSGRPLTSVELEDAFSAAAPRWFTDELKAGGVVEELVTAPEVHSPSAQAIVGPEGVVTLVATHEQVMRGPDAQVFDGSRFPADGPYTGEVARYTMAVARTLAAQGATGWLSVDFVAAHHRDTWTLVAVDLNLRRGGTTHPFTVLQTLVPGRYDVDDHRWVASLDGGPRFYRCSDALHSPRWRGMGAGEAIDAVADAGLQFDAASGSGVVLHSFTALDRDGSIGMTAIGRTPAEVDYLFVAVPKALDAIVDLPGSRTPV